MYKRQEQASALEVPVSCELVELSKLDIGFCVGCNLCLAQTSCTLEDDMNDLYEKLRDADVVLLASPDYFGTVSARMKNFMDRTRPFHMVENVLTGKVGGAMSTAGLNNCGGEGTLAALDSWFATQGMLSVHPLSLIHICINRRYRTIPHRPGRDRCGRARSGRCV